MCSQFYKSVLFITGKFVDVKDMEFDSFLLKRLMQTISILFPLLNSGFSVNSLYKSVIINKRVANGNFSLSTSYVKGHITPVIEHTKSLNTLF